MKYEQVCFLFAFANKNRLEDRKSLYVYELLEANIIIKGNKDSFGACLSYFGRIDFMYIYRAWKGTFCKVRNLMAK